LPIRLLNYINAAKNSGNTDIFGIASAILTALGTSYTNTGSQYLVDKESIKSPWSQYASGWIQNYTAAGLLAYGSNSNLIYANRAAVESSLNGKFGTDGTNGTIGTDLTSSDGFNSSLTLWGLMVSAQGVTPLQLFMLDK
jgi:hypothetical protein